MKNEMWSLLKAWLLFLFYNRIFLGRKRDFLGKQKVEGCAVLFETAGSLCPCTSGSVCILCSICSVLLLFLECWPSWAGKAENEAGGHDALWRQTEMGGEDNKQDQLLLCLPWEIHQASLRAGAFHFRQGHHNPGATKRLCLDGSLDIKDVVLFIDNSSVALSAAGVVNLSELYKHTSFPTTYMEVSSISDILSVYSNRFTFLDSNLIVVYGFMYQGGNDREFLCPFQYQLLLQFLSIPFPPLWCSGYCRIGCSQASSDPKRKGGPPCWGKGSGECTGAHGGAEESLFSSWSVE